MNEVLSTPITPTTSARAGTRVPTGHKGLRRIYNPIQKDAVTFLETSATTNGVRTLIEVELARGGGNAPHFHRAYSERFEVLEGELNVLAGKETVTLGPTETVTAYPNTVHCFSNPSQEQTRFLVEVRPAHTGLEQSLEIVYGLAADGLTNKAGTPSNLYHLAVLFTLSDSGIPGVLAFLAPVFRLIATLARKKGVEHELIERYCR